MQLLFQFHVAEGAAVLVAGGGKVVVILGGSHLHGLQALLRGGAADDEGDVVGRAGRRAQRAHFFHQELLERGGVEQGLGFLVKIGLVGGAAALSDEEEGILHAFHGFNVYLGGQVGSGVLLRVHVQRHGLGVAQVVLGVGVVHAVGKKFAVVAAGPDLLALLADDGGGARVLAEGKDAGGGHFRVTEHRQGHALVVGAGFRIVQDGGHLLQMGGAQEESHVVEGFRGQKAQALRFHLEHGVPFKFPYAYVVGGDEAVLGVVLFQRKRVLIMKIRCCHNGGKYSGARLRVRAKKSGRFRGERGLENPRPLLLRPERDDACKEPREDILRTAGDGHGHHIPLHAPFLLQRENRDGKQKFCRGDATPCAASRSLSG